MSSLADILLSPQNKDAFAGDAVHLIEEHVHKRRGFRGLMLKAGLSMLKTARADALQRAVDRLAPDFARGLEPLWQQYRAGGGRGDFGAWVEKHPQATAAAMLDATDKRIAASSNPRLKSAYPRYRSIAEEEVTRSLPAVAALLSRHTRGAGKA